MKVASSRSALCKLLYLYNVMYALVLVMLYLQLSNADVGEHSKALYTYICYNYGLAI